MKEEALMETIKTILAFIGLICIFIVLICALILFIKICKQSRPRCKEKDYKFYDHIPEEYFMEHYRWCDYGHHYYDGKTELNCNCYLRIKPKI